MLREGIFIGDRYEIIEKVGSGGMADVFKAKDHKLNRYVAIKVMKQEFSEDKTFVSKFRVEAQSAAGLTHPNIVSVYDVGEEDNLYYIVMELVEGITLKRYIEKKGILTVKEAISIAIQVSMGIEAAHNNHIIHRDIKPQNIIISKDGKVKVTDFGIARAASSNTISTTVMGSVHYTSPEQARGGYSDEKSDIYSLGITMFEMLTGRVPFDGDTTVSIAIQHLQDEIPSPRIYAPEIPVSMEQIILKCTQKSPDRRYANMTELIMDLKQSLLTPDDEFVKLIPIDNNGKTISMTDEQLKQIRQETGGIRVSDTEEDMDEEEEGEETEENPEDEPEMNPKLQRAMTILGIVGAIIIAGIAIFAGVQVWRTINHVDSSKVSEKDTDKDDSSTSTDKDDDETVRVMIDVCGLTYEQAAEELNKLNLGIKKSSEPGYSDTVEEGLIMEQSIEKGEEVKVNTTIEVTVCEGAKPITVPDVVGLDRASAKTALQDDGLLAADGTYEYNDSVEAGNVIRTEPEAGTEVERKSKVTLIISRGKEKIEATVPDLKNKTQEEAKAALEAANLTLGKVETSDKYSDTVAEGKVMSQSYAYGKKLEAGSSVDIVLSKGAEPKTVVYTGQVTIPQSSLPSSFESGKVRFELSQTVDGKTITSTVREETLSKSSFPYTLQITGAEGVTTGKVVMYIDGVKVDGEYVVSFSGAN